MSFEVYGQLSQTTPFVHVGLTKEAPIIDGMLSEDIWTQLTPAKNYRQYFPSDSVLGAAQTEIYMASDATYLYVGIKCYSIGNKWIVPSLKRDYRAGGNDNITLVFDTFDDQTNAIFFGINPEGVIREGLISNGGNRREDFSESWDNKWRGKAQKHDGYFTAELEIPFSTLRYDVKTKKWGFMSYRFDTQTNESSTWPGTPQNQVLFNLATMGTMTWEQAPPEGKKQISIIPFVSSGVYKNFEEGTPADGFADVGGDVKIAVTSGLNLDITANPDFSQVEVDEQITNLDRFELFFPERRQFFLENADLFGQFGFGTINPFFSRRIGVAKNAEDETVQNRIFGGGRLSGKLNPKLRIGLLNMQTAKSENEGLPTANYAVVALQQKVLKRSNISFIAVNKNVGGLDLEALEIDQFNRVFGLDFNYASEDNTWSGKTFAHTSFTAGAEGGKLSHGTALNYNKRNLGLGWEHAYVQDGYNAEVGFIRRTNYISIEPRGELRYYPGGEQINTYSFGSEAEVIWKPGFGKTDHDLSIGSEIGFRSNASLGLFFNHNYVHLFDEFDPTGTSSDPLAADTDYNYWNLSAFFSSNSQKKFSYRFRTFTGQYFNGKRYGLSGSLTCRYEPKGSIRLDYSVNYFDMPYLDKVQSTLLIGPRIDYTFSKSLFTTLFLQYNSQEQNTNVNARLQWRFAPVSDFFLVFTDNYFTGLDPSDRFNLNVKNRSIVAKLTYWFNA